jgi:DNA adenine methylase
MTNEPHVQYGLFGDEKREPIVNVASVPQRSPFRYPGGKTWLVPKIRCWLASLPYRPTDFIEPFAGGGIVGLTVAFEQRAAQVTLVELDEDVASVWQAMIEGEAEWLARRILAFPFHEHQVNEVLGRTPTDQRERAFQTILRNRVNRGGILAPGSGRIKVGENGRGMASRWYPETLARRIRAIGEIRSRLRLVQGDGLAVMQAYADHPTVAFFIDPPYTASGKKAGSRLYRHSGLDHEALFSLTASVQGDFLMTYDRAQEVMNLAARHGLCYETVAMKNTHHAEMTELLIGRNLAWL